VDVWRDAARWAEGFWREVAACDELEEEVRAFAGRAADAIAAMDRRLGPPPGDRIATSAESSYGG
jgi:hypothetical protein